MLYLKADKLSQIQDVFNAGPLQDEQEISQYYQDATEARTGIRITPTSINCLSAMPVSGRQRSCSA